jgi:acid phosphatase (class A)
MKIAGLLLFAFTAAGWAQAPKKPVFISAEQLPILQILPAPPANDSVRGKAELAEVHRIQETRTAAEIAHAKADDSEEDMFVFKDVMGEKFTAANLPATALLSAHMHNDEGIVVNPAKQFFAKRRPFNFDPTVKPICKTNANVDDYGYPSGHGTTGYLEALVLVQIAPEKRDEIMARADDYAHSRVVCGVHYPSDGQASKLTAYAMMGIIMNDAQFRKELEAAKAETRALLGLKPGM